MTLHLRIVSSSVEIPSEALLVVEGSQSGQLKSYQSKKNKWQPSFEIYCSNKDILTIKIYNNDKIRDSDLIGQSKFYSEKFIYKHPSMTTNKSQQFELPVENQDKSIGTLKTVATYDKVLKYQGQIPILRDLEMGSPNKKGVQFYKGECPKSDFFSSIDHYFTKKPYQPEYNTMQIIYRDE